MKISVGSDERTHLTDSVIDHLRKRGHDLTLHGPLAGNAIPWPEVGRTVAEEVAAGKADEGILFCWTGTGVSIAANKVPGIRAALCDDPETASGARRWNDANVLALSLRATSAAVAEEIVDTWLTTRDVDPAEQSNIDRVGQIERRY